MDIQKVAAKYRLSKWMQVIQERQCSRQSIKDICREKGISSNSYFYWQRNLRKTACAEHSKLEEPVNCVPEGWRLLAQGQEIKSTLGMPSCSGTLCKLAEIFALDPIITRPILQNVPPFRTTYYFMLLKGTLK